MLLREQREEYDCYFTSLLACLHSGRGFTRRARFNQNEPLSTRRLDSTKLSSGLITDTRATAKVTQQLLFSLMNHCSN